ncbi:Uncharacterised protein [Streptococcus macacae NCTC 11558]|uniref:Uncharacterized protein n=1 Tax=Streptococcus macacae NCTC 11558 TaxID=764298 RepID=G5JW84_9STRE|nr:hypothetical protein STRMA_1499 [Streptococcus macacae NCTC 11558]SUN79433.1 Uncharacterised protein [Streptococcus macacae NCTC 11558]
MSFTFWLLIFLAIFGGIFAVDDSFHKKKDKDTKKKNKK